ncbi:hypothetical protein FOG51_00655 [Hanseniaspora uvarum]|nr:hypothetical protein FOG51_00655 [Hanseniaspora uvarum]
MMEISLDHIAIGTNKHTKIQTYNDVSGHIAVGCNRSVLIYDTAKKLHHILNGHKAIVTCLQYQDNSKNNQLITCSEDGSFNIYEDYKLIKKIQINNMEKDEMHSVNSITYRENCLLIGDSSGTFRIYNNEDWSLIKEFRVSDRVHPLCLEMIFVSDGKYMIFVGGTSEDLFVYSFEVKSLELTLQAKLKGHEDWIKCLDFIRINENKWFIATGSQDRYIRIWNLEFKDVEELEAENRKNKMTLMNNKKFPIRFQDGLNQMAINFDSLIMGHDDWIQCIKFHPSAQKLQLLSATANTELMIWEVDHKSDIWVCNNRLGEISSKGSTTATGSSGGFWSCFWIIDNEMRKESVYTSGKTGSWRCWSRTINQESTPVLENDNEDDEEEEQKKLEMIFDDNYYSQNWEQEAFILGPTRECNGLSWDASKGEYLLSTSLDQTTRLYALNKTSDANEWREFARPQIHGYDLTNILSISQTEFISAGEEKIIRVFKEPKNVANILKKFSDIEYNQSDVSQIASMPTLGLSNKAGEAETSAEEGINAETDTDMITNILNNLTTPPLEDQLQRFTLFPEIEKLYGHGFEISCFDYDKTSNILASCNKSNTKKNSQIKIFNLNDYTLMSTIIMEFHNLTITSLKFSPCGEYLLSCSRDRTWCVWKKVVLESGDISFEVFKNNLKPHTKIIWDCEWLPKSFDTNGFVTVARDKTIKYWSFNTEKDDYELVSSIRFKEPVTAVSVYNKSINESNDLLVSVGLNDGDLKLIKISKETKECKEIEDLTFGLGKPCDRVNKLKFNRLATDENGSILLACSSADTSLRIYKIKV